MSRHNVHAALRTGAARMLGTFGPDNPVDLPGFMAEDTAANADGGLGRNIAAMAKVQDQRSADTLAGRPTRMLGGPAPDARWDGFFGSLQQKTERAADHGLRSRVDLAGHGPNEGIGQLASRNAEGMTEHPLATAGFSPSVNALRTASTRINNNAADVLARRRY